MKYIQLTQGKFTLIDDEDFEWLNQWKWFFHNTGYAARYGYYTNDFNKRKCIYMHRLINHTLEGLITDHINRNKLDNRKLNLRIATYRENGLNRNIQKNNISGYKGVHWHKASGKWMAQIRVNNKCIYLGTYDILHNAVFARKLVEGRIL